MLEKGTSRPGHFVFRHKPRAAARVDVDLGHKRRRCRLLRRRVVVAEVVAGGLRSHPLLSHHVMREVRIVGLLRGVVGLLKLLL
jgi:hypothetical protein